MNDIVVHTSAPVSILPSQTYTSTDEWYNALTDMHVTQLAFQHNDAVEDEGDTYDKFTARQLFRNLATERRLTPDPLESDNGFGCFQRISGQPMSSTKVSGLSASSTGNLLMLPLRNLASTLPGGYS